MGLFSNPGRFGDWGLLVLRVGIGVVFFAHGTLKWRVWGMEPSEQISASMLWLLKILSVAEPLGGVAMAVGYLTAIPAIGMGAVMLGVIYMKITTWGVGFIGNQTTGWELDFVMLCAVACVLLAGPGKISLDDWLARRKAG